MTHDYRQKHGIGQTVAGKETHHSVKNLSEGLSVTYRNLLHDAFLQQQNLKQNVVMQREILQGQQLLYLLWKHMINIPCIFP